MAMTRLERNETLIRFGLLMIAFSAVSVLAVITLFIFREGTPIMVKYGLGKFLLGMDWYPSEKSFGLLPMIVGSLAVTAGALCIGIPLGLACAVFLTEFSTKGVRRVVKPMIELLAGIPSVVYGFMGVIILVPFIRETMGGPGLSVLAASIVLGIMVLPTIISISIDSLEAVPARLPGRVDRPRGHALADDAHGDAPGGPIGHHRQRHPGHGPGRGRDDGRDHGRGQRGRHPGFDPDPVRTLTANIALEMGYASGEHREALFATGVMLFVIIMILNTGGQPDRP